MRALGTLPQKAAQKALKPGAEGKENRTTPTPPLPGAVAMATIGSPCCGWCRLNLTRNYPLLGNRQNVVYNPVQHQTCREEINMTENTKGITIMTLA